MSARYYKQKMIKIYTTCIIGAIAWCSVAKADTFFNAEINGDITLYGEIFGATDETVIIKSGAILSF